MKYRIVIKIEYHFEIRDYLYTTVWNEICNRNEIDFYFLTDDKRIIELINSRNAPNVKAVSTVYIDPAKKLLYKIRSKVEEKLLLLSYKIDQKFLFDTIKQRFARINNLSHYFIFKNKSLAEQKRFQNNFFDMRKGWKIALPFPASKIIFKTLYLFRNKFLYFPLSNHKALIKKLDPDLFVFGRSDFPMNAYWAMVVKKSNIPIAAIVSSWDHPTTKGPLSIFFDFFIVASKHMKYELSQLHGILNTRITQIGKVQMDLFENRMATENKKELLTRLGIIDDKKIITFCTNTTGLKEHEVSIVKWLSQRIKSGIYGRCVLVIRTHPQDINWELDFNSLSELPDVVCLNGYSFGASGSTTLREGNDDQYFLASLMKNSSIVIQSRGSIALDAIAFDTPVISISFDGDLKQQESDAFLHENMYEHYKPLIRARGMKVVGSYAAMDRAINNYLDNPKLDEEGREIIRREHINPLDGRAGFRMVEYLVYLAKNGRNERLPIQKRNGLGDTTWYSRQQLNIADYLTV